MLLSEKKTGELKTYVYSSRSEMGKAAAKKAGECIRKVIKEKGEVNIIFAAAPSQNETLEALINEPDIDWTKAQAFHMDEYIGLARTAPQAFGNFLERSIFSKLPFKNVFYIAKDGLNTAELIARYSDIIANNHVDVVLLGIGENGHIAFNDPHIADFNDKSIIKVVDLDEKCRMQQVNDGCFANILDVPKFALTLTIPTLTSAQHLICTVPASAKAEAVFATLNDNIDERCPATIMRRHAGATMFTDIKAGKYIAFNVGIISDEVSQDIELVAKFCKENHIKGIEIRSVFDTAPENLSDQQIEKILRTARENNLTIIGVCSSIFKCDYGVIEEEKLEKTIKVAKKFGVNFVRAFSFYKSEKFNLSEFSSLCGLLSARLKKEKLTLLLESDPSVNLDTIASLSEALAGINNDDIGAIFDPGNDLYATEPRGNIESGTLSLGKFTRHVHLKDAVKRGNETIGVAFGEGEVGFERLFSLLIADKYDGYLSIETHFRKGEKLDEKMLRNPMGKAFSLDGYDASKECAENLFGMIEKLK